MSFDNLGLTRPSSHALSRSGFNEPTEVQIASIPPIIAGEDVAVRSPTGSGKTLAFVLGLIARIEQSYRDRYVLIFSPTRELAIQTRDVINSLGVRGMCARAVYGKMPHSTFTSLSDPSVKFTVATPRKLWDLTQKQFFYPGRYNLVVLDEADELLQSGFKEDIDYVLARLRALQTLFFSATLDEDVLEFSASYQRNPRIIEIGAKEVAGTISTETITVSGEDEKLKQLIKVLGEEAGQAIVFAFSRGRVTWLAHKLKALGFNVAYTHKEVPQKRREAAMTAFRAGELRVLVGTDVLARGIDIPNLPLVVEFDQPMDAGSSIHRAGRTGRMGNIGRAVSIVNSEGELRDITSEKRRMLHKLRPGAKPGNGTSELHDPLVSRPGELIARASEVSPVRVPEPAIAVVGHAFGRHGNHNAGVGPAMGKIRSR